MNYPDSFLNLVRNLTILPGVGEKTAERYAFYLFDKDIEEVENLANSLTDFKKNIKICEKCGVISDYNECEICSNKDRNHSTICVVQDSRNVFFIEKTKKYDGIYHVLNGLISPIDGINPEDLNINKLLNNIDENTKEVILALNPSIEGEVTSLYIKKLLEKYNIKISRLSYGIPVGSDMEYLDPIMISKALDDRKIVS